MAESAMWHKDSLSMELPSILIKRVGVFCIELSTFPY